jgi:hypothetical protein
LLKVPNFDNAITSGQRSAAQWSANKRSDSAPYQPTYYLLPLGAR